jgi:hypothetical protein
MHVQAFKLASLFAALDWLKTSDETPTVTVDHWNAGQAVAESWRQSAHGLLEQMYDIRTCETRKGINLRDTLPI